MVVVSKETAITKLKTEMTKAKEKAFAEPIIGYLIKRCEEDNGLCEDVLQEHKTWEKCFSFIYKKAREFAKGKNQCAVRDDIVYEWAEDYYHKDDKAEEEKKAKEEIERKKKEEERKAKIASNPVPAVPEKKTSVEPVKTEKPVIKEQLKSKKNEIDGQLDLFALMGM